MAAAARRIRIRRTNRLKCLVCYLVCFALPVLWQFIGLWLIYPYKLAATAPNAAAEDLLGQVNRLLELGHREAILTTQTPSWVAIRGYHRFGFRPEARAEEEIRGWSIVSEKTGIDFLSEIRR